MSMDVATTERTVGRLFVRRAGARGRLVVLLHGLASSSHYWDHGLRALVEDHRLLLPDLLGFGRSPKPATSQYTPAEHVAWLHAALAPLTRGEPFALVGHSAGSTIALHYAAAHPEDVEGLALIALPAGNGCTPYGHREDGTMGRVHRFVAHTAAGERILSAILRVVRPIGRVLAPRIQRDVPPLAARDALSTTNASYWRTLEHVVYGSYTTDLLDHLRAPALLIHGREDRIAPIEGVLALVAARPELRLHVIEGGGHNPWYVRTVETLAVLRDFIDRLPNRAPA